MSTDTLERPAVKKAPEKEPYKIRQNELYLVETARAMFDVSLPVGVPFEEALRPEFWSNVAHMFAKNPGDVRDKAGAIIGIGSVDHAFYGQVYVRAVRERELVVATLMEPVYFGPKENTANDKYATRWNVGARGFDVLRESDGEIVGQAKDFPVKEDALDYIQDVLKG